MVGGGSGPFYDNICSQFIALVLWWGKRDLCFFVCCCFMGGGGVLF